MYYFRLIFIGGETVNIVNIVIVIINTLSIVKCTITFCQFWSTLVSLESAFNAEQENDIIFAVTCTTEEIKIQMKPMTALVIQASYC